MEQIGAQAREAEKTLSVLGESRKNQVLFQAADLLWEKRQEILAANQEDLRLGTENRMPDALLDRLLLTEERIAQMAEGLRQIAALEDPIGEVLSMKQRPNGLVIGQKRVPLGVVGIIYEARPNVTADAFGLCHKTGNAVILKGGSDALHSNTVIVKILQEACRRAGVPGTSVQMVPDTSRETARAFMKLNQYIDVLIPRGGAGLIRTVVENATVPVIETGTGNCHIYVDESADLDMAVRIIENAKTQRIGVCNACESLVIHEKVADLFLPKLLQCLGKKGVEIRGDKRSLQAAERRNPGETGNSAEQNFAEADRACIPGSCCLKEASEEDWGREYLDLIVSVKTVSDLGEAIAHINRYNTGHSEAIITENYSNAQRFLNEVDAAAVYVNASTRFTDGFEFGFGAEIGISTQKLHARGPMGLSALTSTKYIIYGNGQVRE